jgi:hypothetical protein
LEESDRVDASRIRVEPVGDAVALRGAVSTADEATVAELIAGDYADGVANELRVDRGLREGVAAEEAGEAAAPAEDEVLIGRTDMLAGPQAEITSDVSLALEENEPWDPPDEPSLAPTLEEYGGAASFGDGGPITDDDPDPEETDASDLSAPDLSQEELEAAARGATVPSVAPSDLAPGKPEPEPLGIDAGGVPPPEDLDSWPSRLPDASPGVGAIGESDEAGTMGGTPATETGAVGADTRGADPARSGTGGSMTDSGTARGPESRDDPAIREDFPSPD